MSITAASVKQDVLDKYSDFAPLASDLTAWKTVTAKASDTVVTTMGLFGADLTKFLADCVIAQGATKCVSSEYDNYNGWAIGI